MNRQCSNMNGTILMQLLLALESLALFPRCQLFVVQLSKLLCKDATIRIFLSTLVSVPCN